MRHSAGFCDNYSPYSLRREIVGHQGYNISVRYRENTGNATQIISVNIIHYYIYTTLSQIKCLHQARRRLPTRTVCHATSVMLQVKASMAPSTRTRVNIFTCEYFHGFKNYRVYTSPFSYRFRLFTRTRVNLKTITKYSVRRRRDERASLKRRRACVVEETSLQKPACNHGFLFNDLYFLQLQTRINTWCEKIGRNVVFIRFLAVTNMPNSVE